MWIAMCTHTIEKNDKFEENKWQVTCAVHMNLVHTSEKKMKRIESVHRIENMPRYMHTLNTSWQQVIGRYLSVFFSILLSCFFFSISCILFFFVPFVHLAFVHNACLYRSLKILHANHEPLNERQNDK